MNEKIVRVSAVVLRDADGNVLSVRKRGTQMFMLPGGKPETGETWAKTAVREVREELGIELCESDLTHLGEFSAQAANESGFTVIGNVFIASSAISREKATPRAEIAEVRWDNPSDLKEDARKILAPLTIDRVFPLL